MFKTYQRPILILIAGAFSVCGVANFETPYVYELWKNPWPKFTEFMAQSIYEGGAFGGSDLGVTLCILCFLVWAYQKYLANTHEYKRQHLLKYIWLSSLISALASIHSVKWLVSRARPKYFFKTDFLSQNSHELFINMPWPGFMPIDGPRGYTWNSFPSGHTASTAILLLFAYAARDRSRTVSYGLGFVVLIYSIAMAMARSMAGMHWLSDSVASFFITWAIADFMALKLNIYAANEKGGEKDGINHADH